MSANAAGSPQNVTERIRQLRDMLLTGLVERDVAIRLALLAALAGEHLVMVGPPGTAKSLIARRLHLAFEDATYFERLLTRFTVPEELFGPLSIKGLEQDRYERLTDGYLPTASVAFLDEVFKANSAILNALLTLLNEREFDNGIERSKTPLIGVVAASNELPEDEELAALYDRFLLRLHVGPVSGDGFGDLLRLRGNDTPTVPKHLRLTPDQLDALRAAAVEIDVPDDVHSLLCDLRLWCAAEGIVVSDRRWRKVVKLLQVSALTHQRDAVSVWDCWLLQHCLWSVPEDREKVYAWYAERVGASAAMDPQRLTTMVVAWEEQLKRDKQDVSTKRNEKGEPLFVTSDGELTAATSGPIQKKRQGEALFLAPARALQRQAKANRHTIYYNQRDWQPLDDRSKGGKGYTEAELDQMRIAPHVGSVDGTPFKHWESKDAYLREPANWIDDSNSLTPALEPTRHKKAYVDSCFHQIQQLAMDVTDYANLLASHKSELESTILNHLWVTQNFAAPAAASLSQTTQVVATLQTRIAKLAEGFDQLPLAEDYPTERERLEPNEPPQHLDTAQPVADEYDPGPCP